MRFQRLLRCVALLALGTSVIAATPFEGVGEADESGAKGRSSALTAARHAALETALGEFEAAVDPQARARVLADVARWTPAYRVLEQRATEEGYLVRIEADVDVPRLRKQVSPRAQGTGGRALVFGEFGADAGCEGLEAGQVEATLVGEGVLAPAPNDSARRVSVRASCSELGRVPFTHLVAVEVELSARVEGRPGIRRRATGHATDAAEARSIAADRAARALAEPLRPVARGEVLVRVKGAWPARRLRRLEAAIASGVIGVKRVGVSGLDPDGTVRLRVVTDVDSATLRKGIADLSFADFSVDARLEHEDELLLVVD